MMMLTCVSPIDGKVFAKREALSISKSQEVIETSRKSQPAWSQRPIEERIDLVLAGVAEMGRMNDDVVPELAKMMGRPVRYGGEFKGFEERARYMAKIASQSLQAIDAGEDVDFKRYIRRIPHGVVFVIAPWNYPYMTAINTIAPALMAGNTVILKHSTQTLLVGERLASAFHSAGVPKDVFQNVFLDHEITTQLIAENSFDFINFTGSVP
ncbi:MAG: aldehyde dehydrogenase family protein, partial [Paracoccaceae bacterium]